LEESVRSTPLVLATALALTLSLAACSSSTTTGGSSPSGSAAATFDPTTVTKDDAIAALLPAKIKSAGTLTVGADTTYAPAEYIAEDGTTPVGYDVDLAKALGAVLGVKVDVQTASFASIIPAIGSKYDIGVSSFTINSDREKQVNMISYFSAGESYAVPKGNPNKVDATNICGLTVGVQTGTVEDDELTAASTKCVADGKKAINPLKYAQQSDVTTALIGGKVDLMYADSPIISYAIAQTGDQLQQLGDVFATAPQGVVVAKDDAALTEAVQKGLQKLIDSGDYGKILTAWGNEAGAVKTAELNPTVS
jgi:polar amino acid transport system substrate-binding protein